LVRGITIDFKKKIIVNGQEYHSWEEVPEEVRRLVNPASGPAGEPFRSGTGSQQSIVFNGKEYADLAAMPEEERRLFETIMSTVRTDEGSPAGNPIALQNKDGQKAAQSLESYRKHKSASPSLISRLLLWGIIAVILLWGIYRLLN
jgi:hypothetical protein